MKRESASQKSRNDRKTPAKAARKSAKGRSSAQAGTSVEKRKTAGVKSAEPKTSAKKSSNKAAKKPAAKSAPAKTTKKPATKAAPAKAAKKATPAKATKKAASKAAPAKATKKAATKATPAKATKKAATKAAPAKATKKSATKAAPAKATKKVATKAAPAKATKKSGSKSPSAPKAKKVSKKALRPRRLADEATLASAPVRANLNKPPTKEPIPRDLAPEKFRNALRAPIRDSGLPRRIAHGAILPALLSEGRNEHLQEQLDWALEDRVPAFYLAESLLQSYLFVGFPRTINALSRLHEVTRSRRRDLGLSADPLHVPSEIPSLDRILGGPGEFGSALKGRRIRLAEGPPMHLESPSEGPGSFERYAREWWRRGSELCRSVYGTQYARLRENLGRVHPELADWMVFEGYGKVLSRPVITPRERELWIIPLLMVQSVPEQLYSHLRGAKNLGVPMGRIRAVLWLASAVAGPKAFKEANDMLDEIERRDSEQREDRLRTVL